MGKQTAQYMVALLALRRFKTAEQMAAYLGLAPVEWQSGSSVKGRPRLSKAGPALYRKLLYLPAITATKHNPHIRAHYLRLIEKGKSKMAAIGAAMRKLVHLCFGVVRTGKAYRADYTACAA